MNERRIENRLTEGQTHIPNDLRFGVGDDVEVIVLEKPNNSELGSEAVFADDWKMASNRVLRKVWDNDEDAAYDNLSARC